MSRKLEDWWRYEMRKDDAEIPADVREAFEAGRLKGLADAGEATRLLIPHIGKEMADATTSLVTLLCRVGARHEEEDGKR